MVIVTERLEGQAVRALAEGQEKVFDVLKLFMRFQDYQIDIP